MRGYQLTERGKIMLAVVLALIIFVLPSAILAYKALATQPPDLPAGLDSDASWNSPLSTGETPTPGITESPPPNGGGFNPPDVSNEPGGNGEPDNGNEPDDANGQDSGNEPDDANGQDSGNEPDDANGQDSGNEPDDNGESNVSAPPDEHEPASPPPSGPAGGATSSGTLSFSFSPGNQDALDDETVALLGVFLTSSNNTEGSRIAIEIPRLPTADADRVISATINAFAAQGVPTQRLQFITGRAVPTGSSFTVRLYYTWPQSK